MTRIALIRHGPTDWNEIGRIQGRQDQSLGERGRAEVRRWRLPAEIVDYDWVSSPLSRAVQTARLLGAPDELMVDDRLIEMHWGEWEGYSLDELRTRYGAAARANEARGLDFRPQGGESLREMQTRIGGWLADVAVRRRPTVVIAHKGVIRATYALATGWDMLGKPPDKLQWAAVHLFDLDDSGRPRVARLNLPLAAS